MRLIHHIFLTSKACVPHSIIPDACLCVKACGEYTLDMGTGVLVHQNVPAILESAEHTAVKARRGFVRDELSINGEVMQMCIIDATSENCVEISDLFSISSFIFLYIIILFCFLAGSAGARNADLSEILLRQGYFQTATGAFLHVHSNMCAWLRVVMLHCFLVICGVVRMEADTCIYFPSHRLMLV